MRDGLSPLYFIKKSLPNPKILYKKGCDYVIEENLNNIAKAIENNDFSNVIDDLSIVLEYAKNLNGEKETLKTEIENLKNDKLNLEKENDRQRRSIAKLFAEKDVKEDKIINQDLQEIDLNKIIESED